MRRLLLATAISTSAFAEENVNKSLNPVVDVTPTARGCPDSSGPYAKGSFLYWKSQLEKEDIAEEIVFKGTDDFVAIKETEVNFKYSPGLKLGIGYNFKRDYWDVFLNWTLLNSNKSHKSLVSSTQVVNNPNSTIVFLPFGGIITGLLVGGSVHSHWSLHFTTLDCELGRNFFISRYISLRPFIGLKADWINWKFKNSYKNFIFTPNPSVVTAPFSAILKEDNQGVGPRMGINSRWIFSSFAIVGNFAASLLYTDMIAKKKLDVSPASPPGFITMAHRHELKPVLECFLGVDWQHCFKQRSNLSLSVGYEAQLWWDQTAAEFHGGILNFNGELHAIQALMLQGLTASAGLEF
jgi:hypothetical protein